MKITKSRLQQIIQEELSRVLKEEYNRDFDEVFMVITALSGGGMEFWPKESEPDFYNSYDDAYAAAKKVNRSNVENKFYRPESATDVVLHLRRTGDRRLGSIKQLTQTYIDKRVEADNDLDTDNDGKISGAELSAELRDMADDLYVVIGNAGRGRQNMWPSSDEPGVYSKEEAERIAKERDFSQVRYHAKPLVKASEFVSMGTRARAGLNKLLDKYGVE
jgi:hypothetical protein